jgi:hypothetical protein
MDERVARVGSNVTDLISIGASIPDRIKLFVVGVEVSSISRRQVICGLRISSIVNTDGAQSNRTGSIGLKG